MGKTIKHLYSETVDVPIQSIKMDPNNPNKMTDTQLKSLKYSMEKFDDVMPIVIDSKTMIIADGHHRYRVYKDMGLENIPVIKKDFKDDSERVLFSQTMNKLRGEHDKSLDIDAVYSLVHDNEQNLLDYMRLTGVDDEKAVFDYLATQYPDEYGPEEITPEDQDSLNALLDRAEDKNIPVVTKQGDIWQLGEHFILCGDCTDTKQVSALFKDAQPNVIITDPPYSSGGYQETGKKSGSIGNRQKDYQMRRDNLSTRGYVNLIYYSFQNVPSHCDAVYIFTDWKMWINSFDVVERSGFTVRNMLVWDKVSMGMGLPWRNQHELILFGKKTPAKLLDGKTGNVIQCKREMNKNHPTVKPLELLTRLIGNTQGEVYYDPFLGSGSTLMACQQTKKVCFGVEIEPRYCDLVIKRWENYTGRKAELMTS